LGTRGKKGFAGGNEIVDVSQESKTDSWASGTAEAAGGLSPPA